MEGNTILKNIYAYKKKYYVNFLLRSLILSFSILLSAFLFYTLLEYIGHFNTVVRSVLFYSYLVILAYVFLRWILLPILRIFIHRLQLSDQAAARKIGNFFPSVNDKLLNILQLYEKESGGQELISASIQQKASEIRNIRFVHAISFSENKRYLHYLLIPFAIVIILGLTFPKMITESTARIVNYKRVYAPTAPFRFVLGNDELLAFKNEDYTLKVDLAGEMQPENVYLKLGERRIKLTASGPAEFSHTFKKIAKDTEFSFEAAGFTSGSYELKVVNRPNIRTFNVELLYPAYLGQNNDRLSNIGSIQVPEGTRVKWQFQTLFTDSMYLCFEGSADSILMKTADNQIFSSEELVHRSGVYEVLLKNAYGWNKDRIIYQMEVIPDEYPKISVQQYIDTVLYDYLILGGDISDDHGFSDLRLMYRIAGDRENQIQESYEKQLIPIDPSKTSQSFYYNWSVDSLSLKESDQIEYYLEVRDNDGINGRKASRTGLYYFRIPDRKERMEDLKKSSQSTENQIDKSLEMAKEIQEKIEEAGNRLKGKKQMNWQDQKLLDELINDKQQMDQEIMKLQEMNRANSMKMEKFNELDTELVEKVNQLQELMDELLDEETKKLFEELKKLLEEKKDLNEVRDLLDRIDFRQDNFEQELERALELFKRMKFEAELEQTIQEVDEMQEQQADLMEETEDRDKEMDQIKDSQQQLNEEFQDVRKSIEELLDLNQDLKFPQPMENTFDQEENVEKAQKEALEELERNRRNKAQQAQQKASEQMEKLSETLQQMQMSGQMSMMMENYNSLRLIVDNLIKLSFSQETIMDNFKSVNQSDPRFIGLSQRQLALKDDARVIEDSLIALSERVFQISSFITRELNEMNRYLDESIEDLRERQKSQAIGKQQFSMTSMNNLALLLDDVLSSMQQQIAMMMGIPSPGQKNGKEPNLSELQQRLNQQISELKKSGKQGQALSEELAKLAAEQEEIRRRLRQEEEKINNMDGNSEKLGDIAGKMEQTEIDLVNKRLTEQLIMRQEEILTRLLQAEDAMREQELDKDREAKSARQLDRPVPPEFEEYLKLKEKEIELLRTVPPKLNPYYKREVVEYFNRLETSYK